jgi:hypothetical protein
MSSSAYRHPAEHLRAEQSPGLYQRPEYYQASSQVAASSDDNVSEASPASTVSNDGTYLTQPPALHERHHSTTSSSLMHGLKHKSFIQHKLHLPSSSPLKGESPEHIIHDKADSSSGSVLSDYEEIDITALHNFMRALPTETESVGK